MRGEPLEEWIPQEEFLGIIGIGDSQAIASKGGMALEGEFLWTLKDKIDRNFMAMYQQLPSMEEMSSATNGAPPEPVPPLALPSHMLDVLEKSKMRCSGCGSKVGSSILNRALKRLNLINKKNSANNNNGNNGTHKDIVAGIGDDAAIIKLPAAPKLMLQTIDFFRACDNDPFLFGQIAANHALSDIFAMNGQVSTALALCVLPYSSDVKMEEELVQVLAGALKTLEKEGCALVGGHTSEAAVGETSSALGFSVTGFIDPERLLRKGPLVAGHVLILTKAIGSGVILAGAMRAETQSDWIDVAYQSMLQSNRRAAELLWESGCSACTDVTGFGLLGHLNEMMRADQDQDQDQDNAAEDDDICPPLSGKGTTVELSFTKIPLFPGALECSKRGVQSSLFLQVIHGSYCGGLLRRLLSRLISVLCSLVYHRTFAVELW